MLVFLIHGLISVLSVYLIYQTFLKTTLCAKCVLEFHNFLIEFRQTPRSKLLRKNLPYMDAIVEEESYLETSQISTMLKSTSLVNSLN